MLSTGQTMEILGVTKVTLYKWVITKRIKAIQHKIGKRTYFEFDPKEVAKVKAKMKASIDKGESWFDD